MEKDTRVFYDTNQADDRHLNEAVLEDAGKNAAEKIDMTAEVAEKVAHRGIRKLQNEFEEAEDAVKRAAKTVKGKAENLAEEIKDRVSYGAYYAEGEAENHTEKALRAAESYDPHAASDVIKTGKEADGPVKHRGIRNIEQTLWDHKE